MPLHEIIQQALPPPASHPDTQAGALVIIDSLSMLQWCLSGTPEHIYHTFVNWLRLLRQTCESLDTALLTLMQADACAAVSHRGTLDQSDERLFRYLLRTADVWVSVSELPSGRAAACDGDPDTGEVPEHAACHLYQQDWGIPLVITGDGPRTLTLDLRGV